MMTLDTFDPNIERLRILELLNQSFQEYRAYSKKKRLEDATQIALDEIEEMKKCFNQFIQCLDHLVLFQEVVRSPFIHVIRDQLKSLKQLMTVNYSKDQLQNLSDVERQIVIESQKKRVELLTKIVNKYMQHHHKGVDQK